MFNGFLMFGGTEIINAARTRAYVENLLPSFPLAHRTAEYDTLRFALEEAEYRTPLLDRADWVETDTANTDESGGRGSVAQNSSHDFYGLYPLAIEGIDDSTMGSPVVESILDGGVLGAERDASRPIRVRGLLVGATDLAVQTGMAWLRNALRANACAMHGDMCGYSDLRYFLAKPEVCEFLYASTNLSAVVLDLGPLDAETSPLIAGYEPGEGARPKTSWWISPNAVTPPLVGGLEGVVVRWGALGYSDPEVLEERGPIVLRRANHVPNPRFLTDANLWSATSGTIVRRSVGGNTYGRADQASPVVYAENWLPDPSFENGDAELRGWRASTLIAEATGDSPPQGVRHASVATTIAEPKAWIEATMLGPLDNGVFGTLSFYKRFVGDALVTVKDEAGSQVFSVTLPQAAAGWTRLSALATVPIRKDYVVRVEAQTGELRVDGFMLEESATMNAYFDGDTADNPGANTFFDFVGGFSGPSRRRVGVLGAISVRTAQTNSPDGPAVASFLLRAPATSAAVLVELVDTAGTVITATTLNLGPQWTRYALGTPYANSLFIRFSSSTGLFDLDEVMLEPGATLRDYFDGGTVQSDPEYQINWVGGAHSSVSFWSYIGLTTVARRENYRSFFEVIEGRIGGLIYGEQQPVRIDMQDQLDQYDRTLHRVGTTTGVKKIRDLKLSNGSAMEVDFVLTAGNPHAFGTRPQEVAVTNANAALHTDALINHSTNPSAEVSTANYVAVGTGTTALTNPILTTAFGARVLRSTYSVASSTVGAGALGRASNLTPGSVYSFGFGHVRCSIGNRLQLVVEFYTAADGLISSTIGTVQQVTANQLYADFRLQNVVAPALTSYARVGIVNVAGTGSANFTVASTLDLDGMMVNYGTTLVTYHDGASAATDAYLYAWVGTAGLSNSQRSIRVDEVTPIIDPNVPAVPSPPLPPLVPDLSVISVNEWTRYYVAIPAGAVPLWSKSIPYLTLLSKLIAIRQIRVRFFPNPFNLPFNKIDPVSFCGELVVSYLPPNSALTVDGVTRQGFASVAGDAPVTANHLLYGANGRPVNWPDMTCDLSYVMTVDIPATLDFSNLDIEFSVFRQE